MLSGREFDIVRKFLNRYTPPSTDEQWIFVGSSELRSAILAFILHQKYSKEGVLGGSLEEVLQEAFGSLSSALRAVMQGELTKAGLAHEFWFKGEVIAWVTPVPEMVRELSMTSVVSQLNDYMGFLQNMAHKTPFKPETIQGIMQFVKHHGIGESRAIASGFQTAFDPLFALFDEE